jgi:cytoskeletal protein CcmA (bactofilin family)
MKAPDRVGSRNHVGSNSQSKEGCMWKKDERQEDLPAQRPAAPLASPPEPWSAPTSLERATIGRSITLRGDVTGDEDLLIQGHVEGSVDLHQHSVTVGSEGEVVASIVGRVVTVEGRVEGNINGTEQVILRSSALVKGDIRAPRVVLENGARFRGLVDMGEGEEDQAASTGAASGSANRRTTENGRTSMGAGDVRATGTRAEPDVVAPERTEAGPATAGSTPGLSAEPAGKAKGQGDIEPRITA